MIGDKVIEDFFELMQNTEKDLLIIEDFEHYLKKVQGDNNT
jgi:hypothetical protein